MKHFNLEEHRIEFKNLISGPAPVGRILNYVFISGNSQLKHKNGYRSTGLENSIGCAWTTELMIGLKIFKPEPKAKDSFVLQLTPNGEELYNLIKDNPINFDEGSLERNLDNLRNQVLKFEGLYETYKNIFTTSLPFKVLREFLIENGYYYSDRNKFIDDYFESVKNTYDNDSTPYNRNARTTTGQNRVPSLLQLCQFFHLVENKDGTLKFNYSEIVNALEEYKPRKYSENELTLAAKEEEQQLKKLDTTEIEQRYGIDGTTLISAIVRNSSVQKMFKHNLIVEQNCRCVLCGLSTKSLLVGSHIKPSHTSNVHEKINENNGLLLCCNHDKLFDQYLITFSFLDGRIEISKTLTEDDRKKLQLDENFQLSDLLLTDERANFLMEHNQEFQNRESKR